MNLRQIRRGGFTVVELIMSCSVFVILTAVLMAAFAMVNRSMALAQGYAVGKVLLPDYLTMDLRRSQVDLSRCGVSTAVTPAPTPPISANITSQTFTLPLSLIQDDYFTSNYRTPRDPVRVTITNGQLKKDRSKVISSSYYYGYRYDATKGFLPHYVTYYQSGTDIYRKEEAYNTATPPVLYTMSDRRIETGVQSISFTSDDIITGTAPSSNFLTAVRLQVNFTPNFFTKAASNVVGTPGQTVLFSQVFLRGASYGSALPTHP